MTINIPYIGSEVFIYGVSFLLLIISFIFRNVFLYLALFMSLWGVIYISDINIWIERTVAILMIYAAIKTVQITWTALDRG